MAEMVFEVWLDDSGPTMTRVSPENDKLREATMPSAVCVHTFTAKSDFDAFQKNNDWHGWGQWVPEPNWHEQYFTENEEQTQRGYLGHRGGC